MADAASFAAAVAAAEERLEITGGALKLSVKSGDAPPRAFSVAVARKPAHAAPAVERNETAPRAVGGTSGVNIWDKTGGGRDNPNE